ncbi:MAG TPA: hypothetical protein VK787_16375 [Puia sp.]|nr:hypothetical protein [Puia sp.]
MKYFLDHLSGLVDAVTNEKHSKIILSAEDWLRILHETAEETEKIKKEIISAVFSLHKEKEIELFISNYQSELTSLLDTLFSNKKNRDERQEKFYESFYKNILQLLQFIEERFSKYFDTSQKIPAIYLSLCNEEIKNNVSKLHQELSENKIDIPFLQKIIEAIILFAENSGSGVTYKDIMYRSVMIKELREMIDSKQLPDRYSPLDRVLIYINYNDKFFVNHLINQFSATINFLQDVNDKIDELLVSIKILNQMQVKPDVALQSKHPSLKMQLNNWFAEELFYLEKKLSLVQMPGSLNAKEKLSNATQVTCNLSVDQIGIFFRAATEAGMISTISQRAVFEQITPYLNTSRTKNISADSMRSKSYSPEKRDLEIVKDKLMEIYKRVGRY